MLEEIFCLNFLDISGLERITNDKKRNNEFL